MIKIGLLLVLLGIAPASRAQHAINPGEGFPGIVIAPLLNSPQRSFSIDQAKGNKFYIFNFWGTWCAPCIPEMDALARLQKDNAGSIQVIAVSDDPPARLKKYLAEKPSAIWLASDTTSFLYKAFGFSYVGQCAIVNSRRQVIALVRTDSVDQRLIDDLVEGKQPRSNAELTEQASCAGQDVFGVDSLMTDNFTVRGFMKGRQSMGRRYLGPPYFGRRVSYVNVCMTDFYKDAYDIISSRQIQYEMDEKAACDFDDKSSLYCIDLLVRPEQNDSLFIILQQRLNALLPVKGRLTEKTMPVYLLTRIPGMESKLPSSAAVTSSYSFSGMGFEGTGTTIADFAHFYLDNELDLPVVDNTGMAGRYDIKTTLSLRNKEGLVRSLHDIGFKLEKAERKMKVLVLYK